MIRNMVENGMRISDIARELEMDRKTVKKYAGSGTVPRRKERKRKGLKLDPYRDYIEERISRYNLSAVRILEEIEKKGYTGSYSTLKSYCRTLRKDRSILAVYRFETEPGRQAQVDFGLFGYIEVNGVRKKLYAFSYILGYSRKRYVEFTVDISVQSLIRMHLNAFRHTGGIPDDILYDNMKQIVLVRRIKASESTFNPDFMQFAEYYGFNVRLCWPYRPQTKGKIERNIGYIKDNFFRGLEFSSLQDLNNLALEWMKKANSLVNGTTGHIPDEMVKEEPLTSVEAIPEYTYSIKRERKVSRECYVHWLGNRYSVHWKHAGRIASVMEENGILRISIGEVVYDHEILAGSGRISRKKEHFEGLLKAIRDLNQHNYSIDVEKRDLKEYEVA